MADYPGATWDGNAQDESNDIPGDTTRANAADYNEIADEVVALEADARAAFGALGEVSLEAALDPILVDSFGYLGELTIAEMNALGTPSIGTSAHAEDAGTPAAAGSDALVIGDLAEWDGEAWAKIVDAVASLPAAGTRCLVASTDLGATLYSPLADPADGCKIATWDGTSVTPSDLTTAPDGRVALVRSGAGVTNPFIRATIPGAGSLWHQLGAFADLVASPLGMTDAFHVLGLKYDATAFELGGSGDLKPKMAEGNRIWLNPSGGGYSFAGTWSNVTGNNSNRVLRRSASVVQGVRTIPVPIPTRIASGVGSQITRVVAIYSITTAAIADVHFVLYLVNAPATDDTTMPAKTVYLGSVDGDYAADHNTAAERGADDGGGGKRFHRCEITPVTGGEAFADEDQAYELEVVVDDAAGGTGILDLYGIFVEYDAIPLGE